MSVCFSIVKYDRPVYMRTACMASDRNLEIEKFGHLGIKNEIDPVCYIDSINRLVRG